MCAMHLCLRVFSLFVLLSVLVPLWQTNPSYILFYQQFKSVLICRLNTRYANTPFTAHVYLLHQTAR